MEESFFKGDAAPTVLSLANSKTSCSLVDLMFRFSLCHFFSICIFCDRFVVMPCFRSWFTKSNVSSLMLSVG